MPGEKKAFCIDFDATMNLGSFLDSDQDNQLINERSQFVYPTPEGDLASLSPIEQFRQRDDFPEKHFYVLPFLEYWRLAIRVLHQLGHFVTSISNRVEYYQSPQEKAMWEEFDQVLMHYFGESEQCFVGNTRLVHQRRCTLGEESLQKTRLREAACQVAGVALSDYIMIDDNDSVGNDGYRGPVEADGGVYIRHNPILSEKLYNNISSIVRALILAGSPQLVCEAVLGDELAPLSIRHHIVFHPLMRQALKSRVDDVVKQDEPIRQKTLSSMRAGSVAFYEAFLIHAYFAAEAGVSASEQAAALDGFDFASEMRRRLGQEKSEKFSRYQGIVSREIFENIDGKRWLSFLEVNPPAENPGVLCLILQRGVHDLGFRGEARCKLERAFEIARFFYRANVLFQLQRNCESRLVPVGNVDVVNAEILKIIRAVLLIDSSLIQQYWQRHLSNIQSANEARAFLHVMGARVQSEDLGQEQLRQWVVQQLVSMFSRAFYGNADFPLTRDNAFNVLFEYLVSGQEMQHYRSSLVARFSQVLRFKLKEFKGAFYDKTRRYIIDPDVVALVLGDLANAFNDICIPEKFRAVFREALTGVRSVEEKFSVLRFYYSYVVSPALREAIVGVADTDVHKVMIDLLDQSFKCLFFAYAPGQAEGLFDFNFAMLQAVVLNKTPRDCLGAMMRKVFSDLAEMDGSQVNQAWAGCISRLGFELATGRGEYAVPSALKDYIHARQLALGEKQIALLEARNLAQSAVLLTTRGEVSVAQTMRRFFRNLAIHFGVGFGLPTAGILVSYFEDLGYEFFGVLALGLAALALIPNLLFSHPRSRQRMSDCCAGLLLRCRGASRRSHHRVTDIEEGLLAASNTLSDDPIDLLLKSIFQEAVRSGGDMRAFLDAMRKAQLDHRETFSALAQRLCEVSLTLVSQEQQATLLASLKAAVLESAPTEAPVRLAL